MNQPMNDTPTRIQRKREKGWRLPDGARCVDRTSRWGNPYRVGEPDIVESFWPGAPLHNLRAVPTSVEDAVGWFARYAIDRLAVEPEWLDPLEGMHVACFCSTSAEHFTHFIAAVSSWLGLMELSSAMYTPKDDPAAYAIEDLEQMRRMWPGDESIEEILDILD